MIGELRTGAAVLSWLDYEKAVPLADLAIVRDASWPRSHFDGRAVVFMERTTFNAFRSNLNPLDLYGRRTVGIGAFNNYSGINGILANDDLPRLCVVSDGMIDALKIGFILIVGSPGGAVLEATRLANAATALCDQDASRAGVVTQWPVALDDQADFFAGYDRLLLDVFKGQATTPF